jgi:hypothetical protein
MSFIKFSTLTGTERKGKYLPRTGYEGPEWKQTYSSSLSLTSALNGDGWSTPRPGRFSQEKNRYVLYRRLGGPGADLNGC